MKIYIASPYTAKTEVEKENNTIKAIDAGIKIWQKGHTPFIPLLMHYFDKRAKELDISFTYEQYLDWDLTWLKECDAILFLGKSKGTEIELAEAIKCGKTIYFSINDIENTKQKY